MYRIGRQGYSQTLNSTLQTFLTESFYDWRILLYHKTDGLKKEWYVGQENSPIKAITFELNKKICGAGSLELGYQDFPIDADDYLEIYFQNDKKYRAKVDSFADPKGGKIKLIPYANQFQELLINNSFVTKTISEMLQTIIEALQTDTDILWNSSFIDTGSTDTFTLDYSKYETPKKVIDELVKKLDDREWGVTEENVFTVYEMNSTVDQNLFYGDRPYFKKIEFKKDYSKIKATRHQVFKKTDGSGEITRIGQVGYDAPAGTYPILTEIENIVGKKVTKFTASEVLSNSDALDLAYETLLNDAVLPLTAKGNDLDISRYFPVIGDLVKIQDETEKVQYTIIDCESTTNWSSNVSLDTDLVVEGTASITFDYIDTSTIYYYDFGEIKRYNNPEKIGFMIYADISGDYLEFSTGNSLAPGVLGACSEGAASSTTSTTDYLFSTVNPVSIRTGSTWQFTDFIITDFDFQFVGFRFRSIPTGGSATINLDRIQLYTYNRTEEETNIVKANFKLNSIGSFCDVELNQYDLQANDELFKIERAIEKLEAIQNAS